VALACLLAAEGAGVTVVDLAGDVPGALGCPEPAGPGLVDLLTSGIPSESGSGSLGPALARTIHVDERGVGLIHRGIGPWPPHVPDTVAAEIASLPGTVIVDAGTLDRWPQPGTGPALALCASATQSLLVLRACFLGMRRAAAAPLRPSGMVLIREPGRSLGAADLESVLGVRVVAEIPWDPAVARALDAGLLPGRVPFAMARALRRAA